jgi:hypothetical protein
MSRPVFMYTESSSVAATNFKKRLTEILEGIQKAKVQTTVDANGP